MFDLIILGSGPGGYHLAEKAAKKGLKVTLIEKDKVGGVCLNVGCIPSKALLYSAKMYSAAKHAETYGFTAENIKYNHAEAVKRKNKKVDMLVNGVIASEKAAGVNLVMGEGKIVSNQNGIVKVEVNGENIEGKTLVVATGSSAFLPPITGLKEEFEEKRALTNVEILSLPEMPEKLLVVGGGVIGLEMGAYFLNIGSHVEVVEALPSIAGPTDNEVSKKLQSYFEKNGMKFHMSSKVVELKNGVAKIEKDGSIVELTYDKVLVATGRRANLTGYGLENVGVFVDRGGIKIDDVCKTNIPNIYAIGDVKGFSMLAHTAYREADVVLSNILGETDRIDYNTIPSVIYSVPEVAAVGKTEEQLKEEGIEYQALKTSLMYSGRFLSETDDFDGLLKMLVSNSGEILGIHIIGNYASEIIHLAVSIITQKMSVHTVKKMTLPHPTVGELIKDLALGFKAK
jgi:dihydrolipoamide dehydrogenase